VLQGGHDGYRYGEVVQFAKRIRIHSAAEAVAKTYLFTFLPLSVLVSQRSTRGSKLNMRSKRTVGNHLR
jgi:hypothetical protein